VWTAANNTHHQRYFIPEDQKNPSIRIFNLNVLNTLSRGSFIKAINKVFKEYQQKEITFFNHLLGEKK
jgi:hypothetical protein